MNNSSVPPYRLLPPADVGEPVAWEGYPPDVEQYERLVACFLKHASAVAPRHDQRITNGIVDFASREESSAILSGLAPDCDQAGWVDPSCTRVGSVSREVVPPVVLQETPCHVSLRQRAFSMVSVDVPTSYRKQLRTLIRLVGLHGPDALRKLGVTRADPHAYLRGKITFAAYINPRNGAFFDRLDEALSRWTERTRMQQGQSA